MKFRALALAVIAIFVCSFIFIYVFSIPTKITNGELSLSVSDTKDANKVANTYLKENEKLSQDLVEIVNKLKPQNTELSLAIIDLNSSPPQIAGYNMDDFMYAASLYKVFVAGEILRKVNLGKIHLSDVVEVKYPNVVNKDINELPKSTTEDQGPLLKVGDMVTIDRLLELVFTRSEDNAANVLIDIADRKDINKYIIADNNWQGSQVTRKYLIVPREVEEYKNLAQPVSSSRHMAELFYKIETNQLVNQQVSTKLKEYLHQWNRGGRIGLYIPEFVDYYKKAGWLEQSTSYWNHDVGVVTGKNSHYVIAVLSLSYSKNLKDHLPMEELSRKIYTLMESRI